MQVVILSADTTRIKSTRAERVMQSGAPVVLPLASKEQRAAQLEVAARINAHLEGARGARVLVDNDVRPPLFAVTEMKFTGATETTSHASPEAAEAARWRHWMPVRGTPRASRASGRALNTAFFSVESDTASRTQRASDAPVPGLADAGGASERSAADVYTVLAREFEMRCEQEWAAAALLYSADARPMPLRPDGEAPLRLQFGNDHAADFRSVHLRD